MYPWYLGFDLIKDKKNKLGSLENNFTLLNFIYLLERFSEQF